MNITPCIRQNTYKVLVVLKFLFGKKFHFEILEIQERRKSENEDIVKQSRSIWNNFARDIATDTNQIRNEIQKMSQEIEERIWKMKR